MKSPKTPPKLTPTTPQLRSKDPKVLRAELDFFRQKITDKVSQDPRKAAVILSEWLKAAPTTTLQASSPSQKKRVA
jgi:hypothetical protein